MNDLTDKQKKLLERIGRYIACHGCSPTIRDICDDKDIKSTATILKYLKILENKGYIKYEPYKARTIELLTPNRYGKRFKNVITIPYLGYICDNKSLSIRNKEKAYFDIPKNFINKEDKIYALKVSDNDMNNAGIFINDYLIIKKACTAKNGDIILLSYRKNLILRRYYKEKSQIRLQAENDFIEPLLLNKCKIIGKAISLYRKID